MGQTDGQTDGRIALFQTAPLGRRHNKKLCYRRPTARRDVSVEILPTAAQQCRNNLYDKSRTNRSIAEMKDGAIGKNGVVCSC